jgi:hypothetical protein
VTKQDSSLTAFSTLSLDVHRRVRIQTVAAHRLINAGEEINNLFMSAQLMFIIFSLLSVVPICARLTERSALQLSN